MFATVRQFLSRFSKIFSVNFDLLMYWARNKDNLAPDGYHTDDGFRPPRPWKGYGTDQDVFFLHGGLHIYDTSTNIEKHVYAEEGETIIDQVRRNLALNRFPLFVSEPSFERKEAKIKHNPYLDYCFQALRACSGVLFVYGHSVDEKDKHIFQQIKRSGISRVFVSLHGDVNSESNQRTQANSRAFMQRAGLAVDFFHAESVPIWRQAN